MVYTNYSDLVAHDSQGFGSKYIDLILNYHDTRVHTKYMPITELYSKEDGRSSDFGGSACFMYSARFLEGSQDGNNEQILKQKMEQIKKKKQKQQKGSSKKKMVNQSSDFINLPKWMRVTIKDYYFFLLSSFFYMSYFSSIIHCHLCYMYSLYMSSDLLYNIMPNETLSWYAPETLKYKEYNFLTSDRYSVVGYYPGLIKHDYRFYGVQGDHLYTNMYPFLTSFLTN